MSQCILFLFCSYIKRLDVGNYQRQALDKYFNHSSVKIMLFFLLILVVEIILTGKLLDLCFKILKVMCERTRAIFLLLVRPGVTLTKPSTVDVYQLFASDYHCALVSW